jgi:hypothetical protein
MSFLSILGVAGTIAGSLIGGNEADQAIDSANAANNARFARAESEIRGLRSRSMGSYDDIIRRMSERTERVLGEYMRAEQIGSSMYANAVREIDRRSKQRVASTVQAMQTQGLSGSTLVAGVRRQAGEQESREIGEVTDAKARTQTALASQTAAATADTLGDEIGVQQAAIDTDIGTTQMLTDLFASKEDVPSQAALDAPESFGTLLGLGGQALSGWLGGG